MTEGTQPRDNEEREESEVEEEDEIEDPIEGTPETNIWNGLWPPPSGKIASTLAAEVPNQTVQLQNAAHLFNFLSTNKEQFPLLSADSTIAPCLLHLPSTPKVRVLWGIAPLTSSQQSIPRCSNQ